MSSKLVRKLLQATSGEGDQSATVSKKRKRKKDLPKATPASKEQLLRHHVQSLVSLDLAMSSRAPAVPKDPSRKKQKLDPLVNSIGNSRSSSSVLQQQPLQPTLNKRRIKEQRKQEMLKKIARMLKKTKKEQKKLQASGSSG